MKVYNSNFGVIAKNIFSIILFLITTQATIAQKNDIKVTLVTPGKLNFAYERQLSPKSSISLHYQYHDFEYAQLFNIFNADVDYRNQGFRLLAEYRFYISEKTTALEGLYLAPNISWGKHSLNYKLKSGNAFGSELNPQNRHAKVSARGLGLKIGYQQKIQRAIIDVGTNISRNSKIKIFETSEKLPPFRGDVGGAYIELYLGIGYTF